MSSTKPPSSFLKTTMASQSDLPATASTKRKRQSKSKRTSLPLPEDVDLHDDLEHVLTVGLSVRRQQWRRKEFSKEHLVILQKDHAQLNCLPTHRPGAPKVEDNVPDNYLHAEDVRIYGAEGYAKQAWPTMQVGNKASQTRTKIRRNKTLPHDDDAWNLEHGDTIHPLAFSMARLSNVPLSEDNKVKVDGSNLHLSTTDITLTAPDDVPRAILLRCWERAVHAASTTIYASVKHEARRKVQADRPRKQRKSLQRDDCRDVMDIDNKVDRSSDAARSKCQEWNVPLPPSAPYVCVRCNIDLLTRERLEQHFYGHGNVRGCCWPLIQKKQRDIIDAILQQQVRIQVDQILALVMRKAKYLVAPSSTARRYFNWYDILQFLQGTMNEAHVDDGALARSSHPVFETIELSKGKYPLVMNPAILEVVEKRLIDRYADVPY